MRTFGTFFMMLIFVLFAGLAESATTIRTDSSNIVIVNGKITQNNNTVVTFNGNNTWSNSCGSQKFHIDEIKNGKGSQRISVDSGIADVTIVVTQSSNLTAHLYGDGFFDGNIPSLFLSENSGETQIEVVYDGNCFSSKLNLEIRIPKQAYNNIFVFTSFGNITIEGVTSRKFHAKSLSGNICLNGEGSNFILGTTSGAVNSRISANSDALVNVNTLSGDIDLEILANSDTRVYINTTSGDVNSKISVNSDTLVNINTLSGDANLSLSNVSKLNLNTNSLSGNMRNHFSESTQGHEADVSVSTTSGDITVR